MTELIWEGKYNKDGNKVAPLRIKLPFQTVETVNEDSKQRQIALDMFANNRPAEWRNRLIWGDKKYILPALLEEFAGKINLIYIDPPFATGQNFSFPVQVDGEEFTKEPSMIEQKAYRDTWGKGLDSYLQWFYETVVLLHELLHEKGSLYVHMDSHIGDYVKVILDDVFGSDNFANEIIWQKVRSIKWQSTHFGNIHDTVLMYGKSSGSIFNAQFKAKKTEILSSHYRYVQQETGRSYRLSDFTQNGEGPPRVFDGKEIAPPPGKHWIWAQERIDKAMAEGRIVFSKAGTPSLKRYLDEVAEDRVPDIWDDIFPVNPMADERQDYPTQKPEALLERIIRASSNEGHLVLDCFVGSGTTAAVAEKLNRRWIACDLGRFAIHTTRKRLLAIPDVKPFTVQNLGKYERQLWQTAEFGDQSETRQLSYRRFILDLYQAQPIEGYTWLHGLKVGRMVYVGAVDAPVSPADVGQIASEFKRSIGTGKDAPARNGVDVLGWDFAFELNEVAKQQAAQANINMRFIRIPREVLEKKAVEQGDIRFFELAALSVDTAWKSRSVTLTLTDFVIPPDDVPEEVRQSIDNWEQWIDYWAVDWNNREDTFHNEWQDYRSRKKRDLQKTISHTYEQPGAYIIMVKVIDILGNDTTKSLKVEVH